MGWDGLERFGYGDLGKAEAIDGVDDWVMGPVLLLLLSSLSWGLSSIVWSLRILVVL